MGTFRLQSIFKEFSVRWKLGMLILHKYEGHLESNAHSSI